MLHHIRRIFGATPLSREEFEKLGWMPMQKNHGNYILITNNSSWYAEYLDKINTITLVRSRNGVIIERLFCKVKNIRDLKQLMITKGIPMKKEK
jgi:hypothetical protein